MKIIPEIKYRHTAAAAVIAAAASLASGQGFAQCPACSHCAPAVAVKTNLLHDLLITPDLGVEVEIARRFSVSLEGVWGWWGSDRASHCWRVAGGWLEGRWWFGRKSEVRALSGHHLGLYGSIHKYDFALGSTGRQSIGCTYGAGVSYGYSFPIARRLNLDLSARAGYFRSPYVKYQPQCGEFMKLASGVHQYVGITDVEITLVWFPGAKSKNLPDYEPY